MSISNQIKIDEIHLIGLAELFDIISDVMKAKASKYFLVGAIARDIILNHAYGLKLI